MPTVREHSLYKALLIVLVAQLGFLQGKPKHWIQGSGPKLTTYFNQILIINFLLFKKRVFHIFLIHLKRKKKKPKKENKKSWSHRNMRRKWCVDNCSLCNNGNTFLLPALEILIVDAAEQFINKRFVCVWKRLSNQPCSRQNSVLCLWLSGSILYWN